MNPLDDYNPQRVRDWAEDSWGGNGYRVSVEMTDVLGDSSVLRRNLNIA